MSNRFYLGAGGFGDFLILLASFYDLSEKFDVVFFADEPNIINQARKIFPGIGTLTLFNKYLSLFRWPEFVNSSLCAGVGATPRNLDYSQWQSTNNFFDNYGVKEFPDFARNFPRKILYPQGQVCVMAQGSLQNPHKRKVISPNNISTIDSETAVAGDHVCVIGNEIPDDLPARWNILTNLDLKSQLELIRGSTKVYSVDSWAKTWSAMCGIETIVYDNLYSPQYLQPMGGNDWGHNIFIHPWSKIEFRRQ